MPLQGVGDRISDAHERQVAGAKRVNSLFVRCVVYGRIRAPLPACLLRQLDSGERVVIDRSEGPLAWRVPVQRADGFDGAVGPEQAERDREPHVRF